MLAWCYANLLYKILRSSYKCAVARVYINLWPYFQKMDLIWIKLKKVRIKKMKKLEEIPIMKYGFLKQAQDKRWKLFGSKLKWIESNCGLLCNNLLILFLYLCTFFLSLLNILSLYKDFFFNNNNNNNNKL